ncbi:MAG: DUF4388 domain-containing protein [Thermocrinis sp.]|jgi:hypothetical protein|uniref:DUF4388 domain-containing protein n=1 Tax=Thermocrinis sp. TaxID=2024383 RepID=UPI003C090137
MALTGDLRSFNFVDIFQVIGRDRKSGILFVEWKDLTCAYYVKDGEIIFARPIDKVYRVYADKDFDLLLSKLRMSMESLPKTIERFLISRLDMKEGIFSFTPGFIKYGGEYPVVYPIEELIVLASRNLTPEEVERKISDELLLFERVPGKEEVLQKAKLNQIERHILSLVNGERTVLQIRQMVNQDSLLVDRALYAFLSLELIRRKKKEVKQKQAPITLELLAKIIERIRSL